MDDKLDRLKSGAVAGALATAPMTVAMRAAAQLLPPRERTLPPEQITAALSRSAGIESHPDAPGWEVKAYLNHFGYGATVGAGYGAAEQRLPGSPMVKGMLYGLGVWAASYLGWLPLARMPAAAKDEPLRRNALMIGAHLVWGAANGVMYDRLERRREESQMDLNGKVAIVTGGSRGLGFLIARELLGQGCRVAICARDEEELERAKSLLERSSAELLPVRADVTSEEDCKRLIEQTRCQFGGIDVLVNNAGIIMSGPLKTMSAEDYKHFLDVHFWGPYYLVNAALPGLRKSESPRIVNICSIGAKVAVPHLLPYTVSKFALCGYSAGLRAELKKEGIAVTTVSPSLMRTGSQINALFRGDHCREYSLFKLVSAVPGVSISAEHAARQIVRAMKAGKAELLIGAPAKLADKLQALAPNAIATATEIIDRMLPVKKSKTTKKGRNIALPKTVKKLTASIDEAAGKFNEV